MFTVLHGIELSAHSPQTKAHLLRVMLPRVQREYREAAATDEGADQGGTQDAARLVDLAARWTVTPPLPCFGEAGRTLLGTLVASRPALFTGTWFDKLWHRRKHAPLIDVMAATLALVLPILHQLGSRPDDATSISHFNLCKRVLDAVQPLAPVHAKLPRRLCAQVAVALAHTLPCLATHRIRMNPSLATTLLVAPVHWLNSRAVVKEGTAMVRSYAPGVAPNGHAYFVAAVVNLCKLAWMDGDLSQLQFYTRVNVTAQCALGMLCGKFDSTFQSSSEIWDAAAHAPGGIDTMSADSDLGDRASAFDPLANLVGELPRELMPQCCSNLSRSAYAYHNTELERMLRRMSRWDYHCEPHPQATAGLWLEGIVHALCKSARFDVLVHSGGEVILNLVKQLLHRDPNTGARRNAVWGALERLVIGHPDPRALEAIMPVLGILLEGWASPPPATSIASSNLTHQQSRATREHDFCTRVLALVQVLIALNNNASMGKAVSELETLWYKVSMSVNCRPRTAVQLLQICRRGAWTAAEGTMETALDIFNNSSSSFADGITPDSQILTWHTSVFRSVLPLRPGPGLENLGNTCYLNSVVQSLFHTDEFRELLLRGGGDNRATRSSAASSSGTSQTVGDANPELLIALKKLFTYMTLSMRRYLQGDPVITPFRSKLRDEAYRGYRQQDAAEFTKYLLNELADTCGLHRAVDLFGGQLTTSVRCTRCGMTSVSSPERFMELSLSFEDGGRGASADVSNKTNASRLSISELLRRFHLPEILEGPNRYRCASETCQGRLVDRAERATAVTKFPSHLVLSLKRFYYSREHGSVAKLMDDVAFPRTLSVPDPDPAAAASGSMIRFSLYGAIMHIGSNASSGHYVAYLTHSSEARFAGGGDGSGNGDDVWWRCDDATVTPLAADDWLKASGVWGKNRRRRNNSTVYMLLYKRYVGADGDAVEMDLEADNRSEEAARGKNGADPRYFHANAMSVPPVMSEECKVDNVAFMLSVYKERKNDAALQ